VLLPGSNASDLIAGNPVSVGGYRKCGAVAAASCEARKSVSGRLCVLPAKRQFPDLMFVKSRFEV
jgi:hypothetical protein